MAYEVEVDDILRELLREPGALAAAVAGAGVVADVAGAAERRVELGAGAELVVSIGDEPPPELPAAIERAARDLRSCIRRHALPTIPDVRLTGRAPRSRAALLRRTEKLLGALGSMHGAACALLMRGPKIVAAGGTLEAQHRERLPFLRRRIDAEAARRRGKSSHAEIVGDDVFARSFWFDAYLVVFFGAAGWPLDFVRHRALAVARELAMVLPHLDDDPPAPANIRPLPTR